MGFIYSFVSLDDEQLERRRQLLDFYARIAQFSALLPLLTIHISYYLRSLSTEIVASLLRRQQKEHQSPRVSRFKRPSASPWVIRWRSLNWNLDDEVVEGWNGWGTKREWIVTGLWALWLLVLLIMSTGDGMLVSQQLYIPFLVTVFWFLVRYGYRSR